MLIVTRRKGQRIVLGPDIEIVVTDISRSGVKIGIVAPSSLTILRGEVKDAVEQANRQALESSFEAPPVAGVATGVATGDSVATSVEAQASAVPDVPHSSALSR
jgi:carbon storage regulator